MEQSIQVIVELTITEGRVNEVERQMPAMVERVKANEPDITGYQWYLNREETKCFIIAWFKNPEAWLTHLANVEPMLPSLFAVAPVVRWEAFGNVPEPVKEMVEPMGVVIHDYAYGFVKPVFMNRLARHSASL